MSKGELQKAGEIMSDWRTEFQYLLDRKILSRDELAYLFGQVKSIIDRELQANLSKRRWLLVKERQPDNLVTVRILLYASATHSLHPGEGFYGEDENGWGWEVLGDTLLTEVFAWKLFDRDNYPALPKREG